MAARRRFNSVTITLGLPPLPESPPSSPIAATSKHTPTRQKPQPAFPPSTPPAPTTKRLKRTPSSSEPSETMASPQRFNSATIALGLPSLPRTAPAPASQSAQLPSPPLTSPASSTQDTASATNSFPQEQNKPTHDELMADFHRKLNAAAMEAQKQSMVEESAAANAFVANQPAGTAETPSLPQEQRLKKPSRQVAPSDVAELQQKHNAANKKAMKQQKLQEKAAAKAALATKSAKPTEKAVAPASVAPTANQPTFGAPTSAVPNFGAPIAGDATSHASSADAVAGDKRRRSDSGHDAPKMSADKFLAEQNEMYWAMTKEERDLFGMNHKERKIAKRQKASEARKAESAPKL